MGTTSLQLAFNSQIQVIIHLQPILQIAQIIGKCVVLRLLTTFENGLLHGIHHENSQ